MSSTYLAARDMDVTAPSCGKGGRGGASGSGYLSRAEVKAGMQALEAEGEFKDGVFRRHKDVAGKRNVDGYQAIWEHANGKPMVYPKPRYSRPFMMDPSHYDWTPVAGAPGASEKFLGVFTERRTTARFVALEPGAGFEAEGRSLYFVTEGEGSVGTDPLRRCTTVYLQRGERVTLAARTPVKMLHLGMPDLTGLAVRRDQIAAAAE